MFSNQENLPHYTLSTKSPPAFPVVICANGAFGGKIKVLRVAGIFICLQTAVIRGNVRAPQQGLGKLTDDGILFGAEMKRNNRLSVALYGNVSLERGYCKNCDTMAFIKRGVFVCCDTPVDDVPKKFERMAEPFFGRKTPTKSVKDRILSEQSNRCFYCNVSLGSIRYRNGLPFVIRVHWDHRTPFSYSQNNTTENFVASCHVCNGIKSSHLFQTVEEAQVYLADKRKAKGYDF